MDAGLLGSVRVEEKAHDCAGTRTQDLPVKSRLLYRLSYAIADHAAYKNPGGPLLANFWIVFYRTHMVANSYQTDFIGTP